MSVTLIHPARAPRLADDLIYCYVVAQLVAGVSTGYAISELRLYDPEGNDIVYNTFSRADGGLSCYPTGVLFGGNGNEPVWQYWDDSRANMNRASMRNGNWGEVGMWFYGYNDAYRPLEILLQLPTSSRVRQIKMASNKAGWGGHVSHMRFYGMEQAEKPALDYLNSPINQKGDAVFLGDMYIPTFSNGTATTLVVQGEV